MKEPSKCPELTEKRNEIITKLIDTYSDMLHDKGNHELLEYIEVLLGRVELYKELDDAMQDYYR